MAACQRRRRRLAFGLVISLLLLSTAAGLTVTADQNEKTVWFDGSGPDDTTLPTTQVAVLALADTLVFPLRVDSGADIVGWEWNIEFRYQNAVEDPAVVTALIFQDQILYHNPVFFGRPELSLESKAGSVANDVVFNPTRGVYEAVIRATIHQSLPVGDHWILLTVPDAVSLAVDLTVAYDLGTVSLGPDVVDDNDGKIFHPSDFDSGTVVESGNLVTETQAGAALVKDLKPLERMAFFAVFTPGTGHVSYQDDFGGTLRTHETTTIGAQRETVLTAVTSDPATLRLQALANTQLFEHPVRFITVDAAF